MPENEKKEHVEENKLDDAERSQETGADTQSDEVESLKVELEQLKDKYARVHADFDNIKKRLEREKYQALEYAQEKFAKDLIPVVDALEMALEASNNTELDATELLEKVKEGVELTMKQFTSVLEKHGVKAVCTDEAFDANIHNAVQKIDSDKHESGEIVTTFQKGYRYKDRTLRDAMVVIAN